MERTESTKGTSGRLGLTLLHFLLHLAAVYLLANFLVVWLTAQFHNWILPLLRMPSREGRLQFAFNHLPVFSALCGLSAGLGARYFFGRNSIAASALAALKSKSAVTKTPSLIPAANSNPKASMYGIRHFSLIRAAATARPASAATT